MSEREGCTSVCALPANTPPLSRDRRSSRTERPLLRRPTSSGHSWLQRHQFLACGHEFLALQGTENGSENSSIRRKLLDSYGTQLVSL